MNSVGLAPLRAEDASASGASSRALNEQTRSLARLRSNFVWALLSSTLAIYFFLLVIVLWWPGIVSRSVFGSFNWGLMAVCVQLVVSVVGFWAYCSWAKVNFDPAAESLRAAAHAMELGVRRD